MTNTTYTVVRVYGTKWGNTMWHAIGKIILVFKARRTDLQAQGLM